MAATKKKKPRRFVPRTELDDRDKLLMARSTRIDELERENAALRRDIDNNPMYWQPQSVRVGCIEASSVDDCRLSITPRTPGVDVFVTEKHMLTGRERTNARKDPRLYGSDYMVFCANGRVLFLLSPGDLNRVQRLLLASLLAPLAGATAELTKLDSWKGG